MSVVTAERNVLPFPRVRAGTLRKRTPEARAGGLSWLVREVISGRAADWPEDTVESLVEVYRGQLKRHEKPDELFAEYVEAVRLAEAMADGTAHWSDILPDLRNGDRTAIAIEETHAAAVEVLAALIGGDW